MDKKISYHLHIKQLHCYISEESNADEVYIKLDGKKIWPGKRFYPMKSPSVAVDIEIPVEKGSTLSLEVWDHDNFSRDDLLGSFTIDAASSGGPYTLAPEATSGKAKYGIEYEIL